jgi:CHAT domain
VHGYQYLAALRAGTAASLTVSRPVRAEAAEALLRAAPADGLRAQHLALLLLLAADLTRRGRPDSTPQDQADVVRLLRAALDQMPASSTDRPAIMSNLALALSASGADDDLAEAAALSRRAIADASDDAPYRIDLLVTLSSVEQARYQRGGEPAALLAAGQAVRVALMLAAAGDVRYRAIAARLGVLLRAQYQRLADPGALDEAIEIFSGLAGRADGGPPGGGPPGGERAGTGEPGDARPSPAAAANLAGLLYSRFELAGNEADLAEAIVRGRQAVAALPADQPDRVVALINLAAALHTDGRIRGDAALTAQAIGHLRDALAMDLSPARRAEVLGNLALQLGRTGDPGDLDAAVSAARSAVRLAPDGGDAAVGRVADLGTLLRRRFEATGRETDLRLAIRLARRAVRATPAAHPRGPRYLSQLSMALLRLHGLTGAEPELDEAISLAREAAAHPVASHSLRPRLLASLGNALRVRYEHARELADLSEAIGLVRAAAELRPQAVAVRAQRLANLSALLLRRFEATGLPADIDDAVASARESASLAPPGSADYPTYLAAVALACFRRFEAAAAQADLDAAVALGRAAIDRAPDGHPSLPGFRANLVSALTASYELTQSAATITEAIELGRAAIAGSPVTDPVLGGALFNTGQALAAAHRVTGDDAARAEAVSTFARCTALETATPLYRAAAARWHGRLAAAAGDMAEAQSAFSAAVGLLPLVADRALRRDSTLADLGHFDGLAGDAAAVAAELDGPSAAAVVLEQARGLLLGQDLDYRGELAWLREHDPDAARDFTSLRHLLGGGAAAMLTTADDPSAGPARPPDPVAARRQASARWPALLARIRLHEPMRDFLRPPAAAELAATAPGEAVIMVNASRYRSDAFVLSAGDVRQVPLRDLTLDQAAELAARLLSAVAANDWDTGERITAILAELWDRVSGPAIDDLEGVTRVWWVPAGPLSLLPLHAAGHRDGPAVMEHVVSSYAPTVRALHAARTRRQAPLGRALSVGVTGPPGAALPPVKHAAAEAEFAAGQLGAALVLRDGAATRNAVIRALPSAGWAHFACHATTDLADPSGSALHLHDAPLTVRDLARLDISGAYLAYLSSCANATTGIRLLDESAHVAAAFQLAGFTHVVGTLWQVGDDDAWYVAQQVYPELLRHHDDPAAGLHAALTALRREFPANPALWAAYVHIGP